MKNLKQMQEAKPQLHNSLSPSPSPAHRLKENLSAEGSPVHIPLTDNGSLCPGQLLIACDALLWPPRWRWHEGWLCLGYKGYGFRKHGWPGCSVPKLANTSQFQLSWGREQWNSQVMKAEGGCIGEEYQGRGEEGGSRGQWGRVRIGVTKYNGTDVKKTA